MDLSANALKTHQAMVGITSSRLCDMTMTRPRMTRRKTELVMTVPKPKSFNVGCDIKSPKGYAEGVSQDVRKPRRDHGIDAEFVIQECHQRNGNAKQQGGIGVPEVGAFCQQVSAGRTMREV